MVSNINPEKDKTKSKLNRIYRKMQNYKLETKNRNIFEKYIKWSQKHHWKNGAYKIYVV